MNYPFLVSVLDPIADVREQLKTFADREPVPVAVRGERFSSDQLHHEIRPSQVRRAGIEDLRNRGMIHECERLALSLEPRHYLRGVHPRFDHLQRDLPPDWPRLLG